MKVTIGQQSLLDLVSDVGRAVAFKTTVPVLCCIHLEGLAGTLIARGTDMETTVQRHVAATVTTPGQVAMPAKIFGDIVRRLPAGEEVTLDVDPRNWTTNITCGKIKTVVHGLNPKGIQ
jgi:DNA polymerase-3 subunit beta